MTKTERIETQKNEGEGSRSGARAYDEKAERFAEKGDVQGQAEKARDAREDPQRRAGLDRAESKGKARAAEEDPAVREG